MTGPVFAVVIGFAAATAGTAAAWLAVVRPQRAALKEAREDANRLAEDLRREAREEALALREKLETEVKDRQAVLARTDDRLCAKEEALDARRAAMDSREAEIVREQKALLEKEEAIDRRLRAVEEEFQKVAHLTKTQARDLYLKKIEAEFREIGTRRAKEAETQAVMDAEKRAKKVVLDAMQRSVVDYVTEATLAVVELPSEDMKGRIIGREGRNIRAFEQTTGVDLIIDDTPEAVVISCFDPVRREIARLTLMNLMLDGRIHPSRIEELHEKASAEVERMVREAGEKAAERANVSGLGPRIVETLGRLRFRTSYAQNVLDHSVEVARLAENLAYEMGLNAEVAKRAGLLHDIGKALGPEWEGPHATTGMDFLRGQGEKEPILLAVGAHHNDIEPTSAESVLVIIADSISAARPGARRESLENYLKRLTSLEELANSFPGVDRTYAVQAGREVRLIVKPDQVDDLAAARLANDVARRIEKDLDFPGQIKVTVIRETRTTEVAK